MNKHRIHEKRKRRRLFPWLKTFLSKCAEKFLNDNELEALEHLLINVDLEIKALNENPSEKKASELFSILSTMFLHFSWKMNWKSLKQWKSYCKKVESPSLNTSNGYETCLTKLLYCMLNLSILLTNGNKESEWISRILMIFKMMPNLLGASYTALLLVNDLKKKFSPIYTLILKAVLLGSKVKNEENSLLYSKVILLFRRLLKFSKIETERELIFSSALKVNPPANFISWLSSIDNNNIENLKEENVTELLLTRTYPDELLRKLQEIVIPKEKNYENTYDFNNAGHSNNDQQEEKKKKHRKADSNFEKKDFIEKEELLKNHLDHKNIEKYELISNTDSDLGLSQNDSLLLNKKDQNSGNISEFKLQEHKEEEECLQNSDNNALEKSLSKLERKETSKHKKKKKNLSKKDLKKKDKKNSKTEKQKNPRMANNDTDDQVVTNDTIISNSSNLERCFSQIDRKEENFKEFSRKCSKDDNLEPEVDCTDVISMHKKIKKQKKAKKDFKNIKKKKDEGQSSGTEKSKSKKKKKKKHSKKDLKDEKVSNPEILTDGSDEQMLTINKNSKKQVVTNDTVISNSPNLEMCFSQIDKSDHSELNTDCSNVPKENKKLKKVKKSKKELKNAEKKKDEFQNSEAHLSEMDLHNVDDSSDLFDSEKLNNCKTAKCENNIPIKKSKTQKKKRKTDDVNGTESNSSREDFKNKIKSKCKMKKLFNIENTLYSDKGSLLPHASDNGDSKNSDNLSNSSPKSSQTAYSDASISDLLKLPKVRIYRNNKALGIENPLKVKENSKPTSSLNSSAKSSSPKYNKKRKISQSSDETKDSLFSNNELIVASKNILVQTQTSEAYGSQSLFEEEVNSVDFNIQTQNKLNNMSCNTSITKCLMSDSLTFSSQQSCQSLVSSSTFPACNSKVSTKTSTSSVFTLSSSVAVSPANPVKCNEEINSVLSNFETIESNSLIVSSQKPSQSLISPSAFRGYRSNTSSKSSTHSVFSLSSPNYVSSPNPAQCNETLNSLNFLPKPKLSLPYVVLDDIKKTISKSSSSTFDPKSSISSQLFSETENSCSAANSVDSLCLSELAHDGELEKTKNSNSPESEIPSLLSPSKTTFNKMSNFLPSFTKNENTETVPCLLQNVTNSSVNDYNTLTCIDNIQENSTFITENSSIVSPKTVTSYADPREYLNSTILPTIQNIHHEESSAQSTVIYQSNQTSLFTGSEADSRNYVCSNINVENNNYHKSVGTNTDSIDSTKCAINYKINNINDNSQPLANVSTLQIVINLNQSDYSLLNKNQLITNINFSNPPESSINTNVLLNQDNASAITAKELLNIPSCNHVPDSQNICFNESSQTVQLPNSNNKFYNPSISHNKRSELTNDSFHQSELSSSLISNHENLENLNQADNLNDSVSNDSFQKSKSSTSQISNRDLNKSVNLNDSVSSSNIYDDLRVINSQKNFFENSDTLVYHNNKHLTSNIKSPSTDDTAILPTNDSFFKSPNHDSSSYKTGTDIYSSCDELSELSLSPIYFESNIVTDLSVGENISISVETKDSPKGKSQININKNLPIHTSSSNKPSSKKAPPRKRAKSGIPKRSKKVKSNVDEKMDLLSKTSKTISNKEKSKIDTNVTLPKSICESFSVSNEAKDNSKRKTSPKKRIKSGVSENQKVKPNDLNEKMSLLNDINKTISDAEKDKNSTNATLPENSRYNFRVRKSLQRPSYFDDYF